MDADRNTKPLEELLSYIETLLRLENSDRRVVTNPKFLFDKNFELLQKYMAGLEIIKSGLEPAVSHVRSSLNEQIGRSNFTYEYLFDIVAHIIHGLDLFNSLRETPKQSFLKDSPSQSQSQSQSQLQRLVFNRLVPSSINDRYKELERLIDSKRLAIKRYQITLYEELIESILRFRHNKEEGKELSVLFVKLQQLLYRFCKELSGMSILALPTNVSGFMSPLHHYHYLPYLRIIISIGQLQHIERTIRDKLIKYLCKSVFVLLPDTHEVVANFIIKMLNEHQTITQEQISVEIKHTPMLAEALIFISQHGHISNSITDEIFDLIQHDDSESSPLESSGSALVWPLAQALHHSQSGDDFHRSASSGSAAAAVQPSSRKRNTTSDSGSDSLEEPSKKGGANKSKKVRRIYKKGNSTKKITKRTRRQRNKKR